MCEECQHEMASIAELATACPNLKYLEHLPQRSKVPSVDKKDFETKPCHE